MRTSIGICLLIMWFIGLSAKAQIAHGLDSIIVERYYIADEFDAADRNSGDSLALGAVTYRIYVDMAPGYKLQMVNAVPGHPLEIKSTEKFHNNQYAGRVLGSDISRYHLKRNIMALDSWITIGAASNEHMGVLKSEDPDGSMVGGINNNGGSASVEQGLLSNNSPEMGLPLTEADGLVFADTIPTAQPIVWNIPKDIWKVFSEADNSGEFVVPDGAIAILQGVSGSTPENRVLIAQITTSGELSFKLNLQLIAPYEGVERFYAENPDEIDFTHPGLIYPPASQ